MLEAIIVLLVVLWAVGFLAFHITAAFIHVLLVVAAIMLVLRLLGGFRTAA